MKCPRCQTENLTEANIAERIVARPGCGASVSSRYRVTGHAARLVRELLV